MLPSPPSARAHRRRAARPQAARSGAVRLLAMGLAMGAGAAVLAGCSPSTKDVAQSPFLDVKLSDMAPKLPFLRFLDKTPETCMAQLQRSAALFIPLPDTATPQGCGFKNAVLVLTVGGTRLTRPAILRCRAALAFTRWVVMDVQPAAQSMLGTTVDRIKVSDHYSCRLKGGRMLTYKKGFRLVKPARRRMSEHAFANAVDISRIWFADGRESQVMVDWHGPMRRGRVTKGVLKLPAKSEADLRTGVMVAFWRTISRRACGRFTKVLTPEFNWLHRHHIHLDLSPGDRCTLDGTVAGLRRYSKRRSIKRRYRRGHYRAHRRARRHHRSNAHASGWRRVRASRVRASRVRASRVRAKRGRGHKRRVYIRARQKAYRQR